MAGLPWSLTDVICDMSCGYEDSLTGLLQLDKNVLRLLFSQERNDPFGERLSSSLEYLCPWPFKRLNPL